MRKPGAVRIESLDVLRGIAVCGILLMTIVKMGSVTPYAIEAFPARWDASWIIWGIQTIFVDGAMRGLFTLLFGAGMVLMLRRAEGHGGQTSPLDMWARRSIALMGFGTLLWLVFLWPGEILWTYGISGLFLLAFRNARPRTLLATAAAILVLLSANNGYRTHALAEQLRSGSAALALTRDGASPTAAQRTDAAAALAERARVHPDAATLAERRVQRTHLASLIRWSEGFWLEENVGIGGWLDIAESVAFMLIGMALFRLGVLTGAAAPAIYRAMMLAGYIGGIAGRGLTVWIGARSGLDMTAGAVSPALWALSDALFEPTRLLITLGHVAAILTLFAKGWLGRAEPIRALGRMALTVYALQAAIGSLLFYGAGLVGRFALPGLWGIAAMIWIATALFSRWWLARHPMGPAERALRRIAYGRDGGAHRRPAIAG